VLNDVLDYQQKEVDKSLSCYDKDKGLYVYYCDKCNDYIFQSMGCNSRICSCCGKRYTDQWSDSMSKGMFKVSHRHFVMSVPSDLWPYLKDWNMRKVYMDSAIEAFNDFFSNVTHQNIKVGVIVVLHPFGKDMKFQPHIHLILTEGGFDNKGNFVKCEYVPANGFRKKWQYEVLRKLQEHGLPNEVAKSMYKKYPKGFYVWLHKRGTIKSPKEISKYVGRYVRHPAIANSRIYAYDGKYVSFYYVNNDNIRVNVVMKVYDFISALIQHIPPPQFKMIRYYGAYARRSKRKYGLTQSGIKQLDLFKFGLERLKKCPKCHCDMHFVWYCKKPPPEKIKNQKELLDWISCESKNWSR
jgi:Putative transposase/Transposase zinc-binding domain